MAPELSVGGKRARWTGLVASALELSAGGEGAFRTGLVALAPELSIGGQRACRTGLVALTLELSVEGPGWSRLWGVAGSPSLDTLAEGDAPLSPEITAGANGDAVD